MKNSGSGSFRRWASAAGLVLVATLLGCAGKQTPRDRISDPGELIYNGFTVADVTCYKCHGADGKGTWRGADLTKDVPKMSEAAIAKAINEGPGMMPAFKGKLDDAQMNALVAWLHGRFQ
jgi:mono/diheme cytochrome c family protein